MSMDAGRGSLSDRAVTAWLSFVHRYAPLVLLVAFAAAFFAARYTIANVRVNTDTADMLSAELPWRKTQIAYDKTFPQYSDNIVIVVDAGTPDQARDAADSLAAALAKRTDLFESIFHPQGSEFFRRNGLLYLDQDKLQTLTDDLARVQPFLARLSADRSLRGLADLLVQALTDSNAQDIDIDFAFSRIASVMKSLRENQPAMLSWEELIAGKDSTPADRRVVFTTVPRLDYSSMLPGSPAINAIRETAAELKLTPENGVQVRLTGGAALSYDELNSVSLGAQLASIGSLIMVALVMVVGLRSGWLVVATLAALVLGLIFTAFFATVAIGELNLISVAFAVMYIGLGADYAIYLCLRYKELSQEYADHRQALTNAVRHVGGSLALCTLTTSIGFFAFIPTSYRGVAELGIISGAGMFISLFVTLAILPALLTLRRPSQRRIGNVQMPRPIRVLLAAPLHHPRIVVGVAALLALASLLLAPRAHFDHNPLNLQDQHVESVVTYKDLLAQSDESPWSVVALANSDADSATLVKKLGALATVKSVRTVNDLVPADQEAKLMLVDDLALTLGTDLDPTLNPGATPPLTEETIAALQKLADALKLAPATSARSDFAAELTAVMQTLQTASTSLREQQLARLDHALLGNLPGRLAQLSASLSPQPFARADLPADLAARWLGSHGEQRLEVIPRDNLDDPRAMQRFVDEVRTVLPEATGSPVVYLEASKAVVSAFTQAFLYALAAIAMLLWFSMSSRIDVALVLSPLLLAGLLTMGAIVLAGIPFNFANIIALPLLLGMGVDNGIHMVHRFRTAPPEDGLMLNTSTSLAIGLSALTNVSGFGNLAISPHAGTASMGVILTIGILITLACTMFILPSLMALLIPRRTVNATTAA